MMRPALTPEARENQLVSLAVDLAEKQLRGGNSFVTGDYSLFEARFDEKKELKKRFWKNRRN